LVDISQKTKPDHITIFLMGIFFEGTILGLSLAFLFGFGPAFFALIQTGIYRGFLQGVILALGIFINDLFVVTLSVLGTTSFLGNIEDFRTMGIIGGAVLVIIGIFTFIRKSSIENNEGEDNTTEPHLLIYFGKGFILNALNPFVWIFWISIVVSVTAQYSADTYKLVMFFAGTLSVVLLTDIIKTFAASQFKRIVTDKFLILINKIAGLAISVFGLFLILRSVFNF
jgi:threonine/homoserine/homoserine lactone efflux protein